MNTRWNELARRSFLGPQFDLEREEALLGGERRAEAGAWYPLIRFPTDWLLA